jgi:hypothetical protein
MFAVPSGMPCLVETLPLTKGKKKKKKGSPKYADAAAPG